MSFRQRAKRLFDLKLDYYDRDYNLEGISRMNLEEMEDEITFIQNALGDSGLLEFIAVSFDLQFQTFLYNKLNKIIDEYNRKNRLYNYEYDEEEKSFIKKKTLYSGYFDGKKYYRGIEMIGEDNEDAPNIGIKK